MANVEFIDKKRIRVVAQNGDEYVIGFDSTMNYQINERYDNYVLEFLEHLFDKYYDGESETVWEFSSLFMTRKFDPFFYILSGKDVERTRIGMRIKQIRKEKKIRQKIVDNHWLKGVISMPSNIFANTGTNVSVLFIDKSNQNGKVMLIDASKLGKKVKDGKNQKTVLNQKEVELIENTFIEQSVIDDFSVQVSYEEIKEKNYSLSAGQYFDVTIDFEELTEEEFYQRMNQYQEEINRLFEEGNILEEEIKKKLGDLKYDK